MANLRIGKLRQCFNSNGKPKRKYVSMREAWEAANEINSNGKNNLPPVRPYQCEECEQYHLTHRSRRARK